MGELTDEQRVRFHRDGFLVVSALIDGEEVRRLRRAFEEQVVRWAAEIDTPLEEYIGVVSQWTNLWERNEVYRMQLHDRRAATIAAELLACERVRLFHDHVIVKPPLGGETISWHRDLPNWPIAEPRVVSCWLALDDVEVDSGGMRFMPGTHMDAITPSVDFLNESKAWGEREREAVPVRVPAGAAVFHHCLTWHTSPPNRTDRWRRAYIRIYMDADCTFEPRRAAWHPMAARVTVPPGAVFNEDAFPTLPGRSR